MDLRERINQKQQRLKDVTKQIAKLEQEQTDLERELLGLSITLKASQGRQILVDMRYGLVERVRR